VEKPLPSKIYEAYRNDKNGRKVAVLESNISNGALGKSEGKRTNTALFLVRVTSIRKKLLDEDNLCEKYYVDCCRYAGLIPGDEPDKTKIEVCQRKAKKGELEHVLIDIFDLHSPQSSEV
jgi:hypothetical protein